MFTGVIRAARAGVKSTLPLTAAAIGALHNRSGLKRRRRLLIVVAGACAIIMLIGSIMQYPYMIADTAAERIFGGRGDSSGRYTVPQICETPPSVTHPVPLSVTSEETDSAPAPIATPADGLDAEGRPTAETMAVIEQIPVGTDVRVAQGWIMWRLAHPGDSVLADFQTFHEEFNAASASLTSGASVTNVVATMDPHADYSPYLLLAQAGSYRLMKQKSLTASTGERDALVAALGITCAGPGGFGAK